MGDNSPRLAKLGRTIERDTGGPPQMLLRRRIQSTPETVQDFELAAEQRFWDGMQLLVSGHLFAGIYLLGYTAEILLKLACWSG